LGYGTTALNDFCNQRLEMFLLTYLLTYKQAVHAVTDSQNLHRSRYAAILDI